ncbi:MAG TPA: hypothetical protein VKV36_05445, partial [Acidimicrobiales bacterium]|nr:hypothetical protein [Acidimicrobiales bacterium]
SVTVTGSQFAAALGLKSDWFAVLSQPSGGVGGYWLVAADGGVFAFGNAGFFGSMGGRALNAPVVGMAATRDAGGYWLVAADGGIFSFGGAGFFGSMGGRALNQPIVGMAPTPSGNGYWLVAADGGIFSFGDATFAGSTSGTAAGPGTVAVIPTRSAGYEVVNGAGQVSPFGDAPQFGDITTFVANYGGHVVGAVASPG